MSKIYDNPPWTWLVNISLENFGLTQCSHIVHSYDHTNQDSHLTYQHSRTGKVSALWLLLANAAWPFHMTAFTATSSLTISWPTIAWHTHLLTFFSLVSSSNCMSQLIVVAPYQFAQVLKVVFTLLSAFFCLEISLTLVKHPFCYSILRPHDCVLWHKKLFLHKLYISLKDGLFYHGFDKHLSKTIWYFSIQSE